MHRVKILVVDDEVIIAQTLQRMLSELGFPDSERSKDFDEARGLILSGNFGLVILDINLSGEFEGLELAKICDKHRIPYFFLTSYSDRETFFQAKASRPGSYVIKPFSQDEIMVAVELTLMGSSTEIKEKVTFATEHFQLSKREAEIVEFIFKGSTNQQMGEKMSLSLNTIKYHLKHIFSKMAVSSKVEITERIDQSWRSSH